MPEPKGNINLGDCEMEGEQNWPKWNVFQKVQAAFVSSTNYLGSAVPQSCLSAGLRRLEKQFWQ